MLCLTFSSCAFNSNTPKKLNNTNFGYIVALEIPGNFSFNESNIKQIKKSKQKIVDLLSITPQWHDKYTHLPYIYFEDLSNNQISDLSNVPSIVGVFKDKLNFKYSAQSLPIIEQPFAISKDATGEGQTVVVLDTGADYFEPDLGSCSEPSQECRIIESFDVAPEDFSLDADPFKHGTNVASIIALVAPDSDIVSIDVFDGDVAFDSDILEALNWVVVKQTELNIKVINMSLGSSENHTPVCVNTVYDQAFSILKNLNVSVIAASGNDAVKDGLSLPACHPYTVSVGATTDDQTMPTQYNNCRDDILTIDSVPCFSNNANTLDLLAPGTNIQAGGVSLTGTSQATPHAAAAFAALYSKFPDKSHQVILNKLKATGKKISDEHLVTPRINIGGSVNERPIGILDNAEFIEGGGIVIDVLKNDIDEEVSTLKIKGVTSNDVVKTQVIDNKLYVYSNSETSGNYTFRYTLTDRFGANGVGKVNVKILPTSINSTKSLLTEKNVYHSRSIRDKRFYEIFFQDLDNGHIFRQSFTMAGEKIYEPSEVTGANDSSKLGRNFAVKSDDKGYTVAWKEKPINDRSHIMARNNVYPILGDSYKATWKYEKVPTSPTITNLDSSEVIIGWVRAHNPSSLYSSVWGDQPGTSPHEDLQQLTRPLVLPDFPHYDTLPLGEFSYLHFLNGSNGIEVRKFNRKGEELSDKKVIANYRYGNVGKFDIKKHGENQFIIAWTHSVYVGKKKVFLKVYDYDLNSVSPLHEVVASNNAMNEVQLISNEKGRYRIVWSEMHGDFAAIMSASFDGTKVGQIKIDDWTENSNYYVPQYLNSISFPDDRYFISWSNPSFRLFYKFREGFKD